MSWKAVESRSAFVAWATEGDDTRYAVVSRHPCPGLGWARFVKDHRGEAREVERSTGAFYDGADDHPEGAVAWAAASARRHETKVRAHLHWLDLASEEEGRARRLEEGGRYAGVHLRKATLCARTAESIRLEVETGQPHCSVCLGAHPNHECPHRQQVRRK